MDLYQKLLNQAEKVANFKSAIPANALNLMMPSDGVPFITKLKLSELLVVEDTDRESGYKSTYYVDVDIAEKLPVKKVAQKELHLLQTHTGEIRFALLSKNPKNSWNVSKLEALKASSEGKVISVKRDKEAKVYAHKIEHDIPHYEIDMSQVEKVFTDTFSHGFSIESLDHPVAQKLLAGENGDVVDVQPVVKDDAGTVDAAGTSGKLFHESGQALDLDLPDDREQKDNEEIPINDLDLELEKLLG
ncbi:hypothetical protein [Photobacterium halotolerans]|uniref:Uncharacterized protein n=1 Tax=Photobacterium halotolerans TaxID=265726 RepID=A0A0F5V6Z2_9GAMM|nr:hypothetical protein [Photobacterium halotolerans]KKC97898.1 hypothetical protein KY46_21400 [Photobacterium halotolerans]